MKKIFFLLACIALKSNAQQLTLNDAINIALKNSFDIQIAKNTADANKINNNIGIAGGLPTVSATATNQESVVNINQKLNTGTQLTRDGAKSNNLTTNVSGTMLLYNGYRVVATKKRLEALQQQSEQNVNSQIQNTIANVMVNYYNVVRQQGYIKTLEQSIELSKQQLTLIENKQTLGLANNANLFQAQIDLNTRIQEMQNQQQLLEQATTDLLNVLNVKPDTVIRIADTIVVDKNIRINDVLQALNANPQINALNSQIKINELLEKETASQRNLSLRANAGINYGRNQSNGGQLLLNQSFGPFLGLTLSVPLYNSGIVKRQEQIAKINTTNAKLQKENTELDFKSGAIKTYQSYTGSLQQLKIQKSTYQLAQQLVQLALQRFQLAAATIIEVREAQKSFEEAGYRLINLSYLAKLAEIELKRVSNNLAN